MAIIYLFNCYINGNIIRKLVEYFDNLIYNVFEKLFNDLGEIMNVK